MADEARIELAKPDEEREDPFRDRNRGYLIQRMAKRLHDMHLPNERALIDDAVAAARAAGAPH